LKGIALKLVSVEQYIVIAAAALFASLLTFFSGFGLGTMLMPVFAIFFPLEAAIALTAIVHFLNNIFKLGLIGRHAEKRIILRFGLPAIIGAFAGALLLLQLEGMPPLHQYYIEGFLFKITLIKLIIAVLILGFAILESMPARSLNLGAVPLWFGGIISGFFGGLSGHQGALRSAFLIKYNLTKEAFIATGVVIACLVDVTRLSLYSSHFGKVVNSETTPLLITGTLAAFTGAFIGARLLKKATYSFIQTVVTILLVLISVALGAGLI
jgi:uncharacterized protein